MRVRRQSLESTCMMAPTRNHCIIPYLHDWEKKITASLTDQAGASGVEDCAKIAKECVFH
jgi:hypothetical protein